MKLLRVLTAIIFSGIVCSAFAQDEYPAEVDSAWIASQNGGSTELNDGNNEEAPACIGDGCNGTETATTASTAPEQDTTAKAETVTAAKGKKAEDDSDEEDCTPADSLLPECKDDQPASRYDDDDDDTYDRYANENADISRASREGFSNGFTLGFRFGGGFNAFFLGERTENWRLGYEASAGIVAQTKIGIPELSISVGLQFSYFRYRYEANDDFEYDDYSEKDEAQLNVEKDELRGFDLGVDEYVTKPFSPRTLVARVGAILRRTAGKEENDRIELSGIVEFGYLVNRNFSVDLRLLQRFTNLLNNDVVEVSEIDLKKAALYGFHVTIGLSLYL